MRTSSNPRCRAASARLRASPECPQMTGIGADDDDETAVSGSRRSSVSSRQRLQLRRSGGTGAHGRGADGACPIARRRAELDEQVAGAVELRAGDPGALERLAVELTDCTYCGGSVRRRLDEPGRSRSTKSPPPSRMLDRANDGRVDEEEALARDGEQPERRPHVPGARARPSRRCRAARRGRCRTVAARRRARPRWCGRAGRRSGRPRAPPCRARC